MTKPGIQRPSADLHRRVAGQHHSGDPQGRRPKLRDDVDEIEARRRHSGRPLLGPARRAPRSRAEQDVSRQLSRRPVRPQPRPVHRDREHAEAPSPGRCAIPGWRSSAFPATRRARDIARRYRVPRQLEANGLEPDQVKIDDEALSTIIQHYTRRGRRQEPRAGDRPGAASGRHARRRGREGSDRNHGRSPARGQRLEADQVKIDDEALSTIIQHYTRGRRQNLEREAGARA